MRRYIGLPVALILLAVTLGARCEAPDLLPPDRNRPPDTFLSRGPEQREVAFFKVHLFWKGYDTDGTVSDWQYAIDDTVIRPDAEIVGTGWLRTTKSDSVFVFLASTNGTDQQRDHTFFIASVDNEGKPDATPSVLQFKARTVAPPVPEVTRVVTAEGDTIAEGDTVRVFSTLTLCWGGSDADGEILKMSYKLDPLDIGFRTVDIRAESCVVYDSLPSNATRESYHFLLVAEDDAGSRNIRPVERQFVVNHDPQTRITLFYAESPWGDVPEIVPGDTIRDSSRVTFSWEAEDVDGDIKGAFWAIGGLNIFSDPELQDSAETRSATADHIVSDQNGAFLIVGSFDEYGRAEGSPDTIPFYVNYPPTVTITKPAAFSVVVPDGRMTLAWRGEDRDGRDAWIDYDVVRVYRKPGGEEVSDTRTIEADLPDSLRLTDILPGIWTFKITPTDRKGLGKSGPSVMKSISVSAGAGGSPE